MTVLSDLGVLWRWSAKPGRGFSVEQTCTTFQVVLWELWKPMRSASADTRGGALASAARWARKEMGEGR